MSSRGELVLYYSRDEYFLYCFVVHLHRHAGAAQRLQRLRRRQHRQRGGQHLRRAAVVVPKAVALCPCVQSSGNQYMQFIAAHGRGHAQVARHPSDDDRLSQLSIPGIAHL